VIDLFEGFEQAIRAQTPTKSNGFDDLVDDPRAETKESPVVTPSTKIMLYTCPACGVNVFGTAKFATAAGEVPTLNDNGSFTVNMEMVGVRADKHDCSPKVAR
jgi:hypothetical protein